MSTKHDSEALMDTISYAIVRVAFDPIFDKLETERLPDPARLWAWNLTKSPAMKKLSPFARRKPWISWRSLQIGRRLCLPGFWLGAPTSCGRLRMKMQGCQLYQIIITLNVSSCRCLPDTNMVVTVKGNIRCLCFFLRFFTTEAVTLFRFDSHFAAFRCTDLVIRAVDVLVTKPSELAFFPAARRLRHGTTGLG